MSFESFIFSLINNFSSVLARDTILTLKRNINVFRKAFTVEDYEVFEQIGDVIISHFIIDYSYKKFPFLNCKEGVKIVARVRIKYASCQYLAEIAQELNFWDHINGKEEDITESRRLSLLEDVFEAFIGAVSLIIDEAAGNGTGFIICSFILKHLYDKRQLSLSYENLFDAKTRLKELGDFYKKRLVLSWKCDKVTEGVNVVLVYFVDNNKYTLSFSAKTKAEAEQVTASRALNNLKEMGIKKEVPEMFRDLS